MWIDYEAYLRSPEWRDRAKDAKKRAGYSCMLCCNKGAVEVHHRNYERVGREQPSDLVVLCESCHHRHHGTLMRMAHNHKRRQMMLPFEARRPSGPELN